MSCSNRTLEDRTNRNAKKGQVVSVSLIGESGEDNPSGLFGAIITVGNFKEDLVVYQ